MSSIQRQKRYEVSRQLGKVALGQEPADLVIKSGTLVNVFTGELQERVDVAMASGRIAYIGNADHDRGGTRVIEANGRYISPACLTVICMWRAQCSP